MTPGSHLRRPPSLLGFIVLILLLSPTTFASQVKPLKAINTKAGVQPKVLLNKTKARAGPSMSVHVGASIRQAAVALQSTPFDSVPAFQMQEGSRSINEEGDEIDASGRPLTIEATPLDGQSSSESESESGSGSNSGSSFSSSLSDDDGDGGSFSPSSISGPVPLRSSSSRCGCNSRKPCPVGITPGPCGGGGPLMEAKIVPRLSGSSKKFKGFLQGHGVWTFTDGSFAGADQNVNQKELEHIIESDSVFQQLTMQREQLQDRIENEKIWVEDVQNVIAHYKAKVGVVVNGLKNQLQQMKRLQVMVESRKKLAARKALEMKLQRVNTQLQQLQATTSSVSGEAKGLVSVQTALNKSIQSIQNEIERLRSSN